MTLPPKTTAATGQIYSTFEAFKPQALHEVPILAPSLIVVRQGEKRFYHGAEQIQLQSGTAFVLPAGITPKMENIPHQGRYFAEFFTPEPNWLSRFREYYGDLLVDLPLQHQRFPLTTNLEQLLQQCKQLQTQPSTLLITAQMEVLWSQILLELITLGAGSSFFVHSSQPLADRVRHLMSLAPSEHWQADWVAERVTMSSATLRRKLQKESTSFSQILVEVRMAKALGLLATTKTPINQVAWQCGYESHTSFNQAFKRHFKMSPTELRATQEPST